MYCSPITESEAIFIAWFEGKGMRFKDRIEYTKKRYKVILQELKFGS